METLIFNYSGFSKLMQKMYRFKILELDSGFQLNNYNYNN